MLCACLGESFNSFADVVALCCAIDLVLCKWTRISPDFRVSGSVEAELNPVCSITEHCSVENILCLNSI